MGALLARPFEWPIERADGGWGCRDGDHGIRHPKIHRRMDDSTTGKCGGNRHGRRHMAMLLPLLNVSIPFSLYTSFDYLGFWLYALFAVLMMKPLFGSDWQSKLIAILVGLFGIGFHGAFAGLLLGFIQAPDIEVSFGLSFIPLLLLLPIQGSLFGAISSRVHQREQRALACSPRKNFLKTTIQYRRS